MAEDAHLEDDSLVEVSLEDSRLVVTPVRTPELTLEELLSRVTEENVHGGVDTGPATGKEVW